MSFGINLGRFRIAALAVIAIIISLFFVDATSKPAEAAISRCNDTYTSVLSGSGASAILGPIPMYMPYNSMTADCFMNQSSLNGVNAVAALQRSMNSCYGESLVVDGSFGSLTTAALKRTQKKIGVTQDGVYGPATRAAMKWVGYNSSGNPLCVNPSYL